METVTLFIADAGWNIS